MEYVFYILSFVVWSLLGYFIFFATYKNKKVVDELKTNLKKSQTEVATLKDERDELKSQNDFLKESVIENKTKKEELSNIVSDIAIYISRIKEWLDLSRKLQRILSVYDEETEEKIKEIKEEIEKKNNSNDEKQNSNWDSKNWDSEKKSLKKFF